MRTASIMRARLAEFASDVWYWLGLAGGMSTWDFRTPSALEFQEMTKRFRMLEQRDSLIRRGQIESARRGNESARCCLQYAACSC